MSYISASASDICEIFASMWFWGVQPSNAANKIFPQLTPVAMATKFWTKWATTQLL